MGEHPIRKRDDQHATAPHHPQQFGGDRLGLLQVLPARHHQGRIDAPIAQGQMLVGVEVLHPVATEAGVGLKLPPVEAVANHLRVVAILRQMAHPAAHQVEHHGALGDALAVQLGEPGPEGGIEVLHETRFCIEERVVGAIDLLAVRSAQHLHHHGQPIGPSILVAVPIERGSADHASFQPPFHQAGAAGSAAALQAGLAPPPG